VNAKRKGIDSKGWAFRMLWFSKREKREEGVRSLEEISKNLSGNLTRKFNADY
jgi:hypothetical protein